MKNNFQTLFQKFVKIESLSGILLFGATVIAMVWANSPYGDTYQALWDTKIGIGTDSFGLNKPLILSSPRKAKHFMRATALDVIQREAA